MSVDGINRRKFLKQFTLLSTAPLITLKLAGCGSDGPGPTPVYGPPPVDDTPPEIQGFYIHDPQSGNGLLNDSTNVDVDASFEIEFTKQMDPAAVDAVHLLTDDIDIDFDGSWWTPKILIITPVSPLRHGIRYTLSVDETAKDIYDNQIDLTGESIATFDTV